MRSRLTPGMPASRARCREAAVASGVWTRSRKASSAASKLWAPKEMRFTPAAASARRAGAEVVPGLASRLISASGARGAAARTASMTAASDPAGISPGVPPPKAMDVTSRPAMWGAQASISATTAAV